MNTLDLSDGISINTVTYSCWLLCGWLLAGGESGCFSEYAESKINDWYIIGLQPKRYLKRYMTFICQPNTFKFTNISLSEFNEIHYDELTLCFKQTSTIMQPNAVRWWNSLRYRPLPTKSFAKRKESGFTGHTVHQFTQVCGQYTCRVHPLRCKCVSTIHALRHSRL